MRNRQMDAADDYAGFSGSTRFLVDSPAAVAQAVLTRMRLYTGEWFLDTEEGLDKSLILGYGTAGTRDVAIQQRILGTPGVQAIDSYSSNVDSARGFTVACLLTTIYGEVALEASF